MSYAARPVARPGRPAVFCPVLDFVRTLGIPAPAQVFVVLPGSAHIGRWLEAQSALRNSLRRGTRHRKLYEGYAGMACLYLSGYPHCAGAGKGVPATWRWRPTACQRVPPLDAAICRAVSQATRATGPSLATRHSDGSG